MNYIKLNADGTFVYPYGLWLLATDFPNTSFPQPYEKAELSLFGVYQVKDTVQPTYDAAIQKLVEVAPVKNSSGVWIQAWAVVAMDDAEKAQADADKETQVRANRNEKLSLCDWTQLADAPVDKAAWATYRQALRDITAQPGFPWSVDWPVAP